MINRVLIRIKVVQLLYSYLLTEKLFTLESQPTPPTKEKRFAYKLYLDVLTLMTRIAGNVKQKGDRFPLLDNRFIRTVLSDEKIKSQLAKDRLEPSPLASQSLVDSLALAVKDSAVYKAYLKNEASDLTEDLKVWRDIFHTILMPDASLQRIYAGLPNYSLRGVERMNELMDSTFTNFSSSQGYMTDASKTLEYSLGKARELYFALLQLIVEITRLQAQNLDAARHKYLASDSDLNPNLKFVENSLAAAIADDPEFRAYVEAEKISWLTNDRATVSALLKQVMASDFYQNYMEEPGTSFHDDCQLWKNLLRYVVFPSDDLEEAIESKSVYWNDDLDTIGTFVLKTIRRYEDGEATPLLPKYKDDEDARFGRELFNSVLKSKEDYRAIIDEALNKDSWETDRLAFMDTVIVSTALAELLNFPKIPVSVTINEYIEIAKAYSTPKSSFFINGLLGAAVNNLRMQGRLVKP